MVVPALRGELWTIKKELGSWYFSLLAPQSGALRISAYRDFHPIPIPSHPNPLIAFEHLSLSMVI